MAGQESEHGPRGGTGRRSTDPPRPRRYVAAAPAARVHIVRPVEPPATRRPSVRTKVVGLGLAGAAWSGLVAAVSFDSPTTAAVLAGGGSLALVGAAIGITGSIVRPLRDLGRHLRRFGEGDLSSRAPVSADEIGLLARSFNLVADSLTTRVSHLEDSARQAAQLRAIGEALEMANDEDQVHCILERAIGVVAPGLPAELLMADHGLRLRRVASNPVAGEAGCPVEHVEDCVAMRRALPVSFSSPSSINACPQLVAHDDPCSAACVPVGGQGQLLGVLHATAREGDPPRDGTIEQLVAIAGLVSTRIGAIRALESSRLEASTDGLTGLANRRKFEAAVQELLNERVPFSLVMADIDHFKRLNDTFGHEVGDRALQVFASVLEDNVRGHDIVARYGGEEFVLVYPRLPAQRAIEVLDRIRGALGPAIEAAGLPEFTTSFGIAASSISDSLDDIIRVADAGLFAAKQAGRNRIVLADQELVAQMFPGGVSPDAVIDLTDDAPAAASEDH